MPAPSWNRTLAVLAIASSVAVSVIYLPQSMLTALAVDLGVAPGAASLIATAVQIGYAVGIFLFVPLADKVHPKRQVTIQSIALTAALLVSAVMPTVVAVALGFLVVGLVANIAQVLIPVASRLAPDGRRGSTTGTMVGALLVGIFGGRIVASVLVETIGWRWVVVLFAGLMLATVPFLRKVLDIEIEPSSPNAGYGGLLAGTLRLARRSPELVESAVIQFFVFATFNSFWTVMVLHLTAEPYNWTVLQAGLFGFVGLAAGFVTPLAGRLTDAYGPLRVTGVGLLLLLLASASVLVDSHIIAAFGVTLFAVTLANQSIQSANQSRVLAANPGASAQANTLFMVGVFLGGSTGAIFGPLAYQAGEMVAVAWLAVALVVASALAWAVAAARQRRLTTARSDPGSR
ncbi:MFS transporter [Actinomycetes bacterium M1A6_2h]